MPWPLSSSKARSRPASSAVLDSSGLSLGDTSSERRSASLDLSRSGLSALTAVQDDSKRDRRSSFPRLALPSWRTPASKSSGDNEGEEGGVELVPGHATPYSANGLRGGFAPDDTQLSSRSSSIRSGSVQSRYYNGDDQEDEEEDSLRTGGSSRTRVMVSPYLTPVDSGWSEFGPDSTVPEELDSPNAVKPTAAIAQAVIAEDASKEQIVPTPCKRRTRGWFSFSSTANGGLTPTSEDPKMFPVNPLSASRTGAAHPSVQVGATDSSDSQAKADKQNTVKGKFTFPSRRRGNSELSMKNMDD